MHSHQHGSRRDFLAHVAGASFTGASILELAFFRAARARAQAQSSPQAALFDIQKVAEGVYAAIARPEALLNCNAVIFENSNDLLIVDAHSKPSAAAALAAQIQREVSQKPVGYIVNTHFHWDHTQGDAAYHRIAPHAHFVSSSATRDLLSQNGAARARQSVEGATVSLDSYQKQLEAAKTAADRARLQRMIAEVKAYIVEMKGYSPELPDVTFDQSLVIHDKNHDLQLMFRGRGHTAGDVVVFCPQRKVVATGDLLHGWFPFLADGYPREWPKTLSAVEELPFETVVGGHGNVQRGKKRLGQMRAYIAELTEAVEAGKRKGQTSAQLQAALSPGSLRSLDADYRSFLVSQNTDPTVTAEMYVVGGVKGNIADIYLRV